MLVGIVQGQNNAPDQRRQVLDIDIVVKGEVRVHSGTLLNKAARFNPPLPRKAFQPFDI